jgi:hypothetical protein
MQLNIEELLEKCPRPKHIRYLLNHPRAAGMSRDGGCFCYVHPKTKKLVHLSGITSILKDLYWPTWKPWHSKAKMSPVLRSIQAGMRNRKNLFPPPSSSRGKESTPEWGSVMAAAKGNIRGSMIHRQLDELLTLDEKSFAARNPEGPHPWLPYIIYALGQQKKALLKCNYGIYDERINMGTELDGLGVDQKTGVPFVIELKTVASLALFHYEEPDMPFDPDCILRTDRNVVKALERRGNSAATRAMIQLGIATLMTIHSTGLKGDIDAWVVVLSENDVQIIELGYDFFMDVIAPLYADMLERVPLLQEARHKKRGADRLNHLKGYMPPPPDDRAAAEEEEDDDNERKSIGSMAQRLVDEENRIHFDDGPEDSMETDVF